MRALSVSKNTGKIALCQASGGILQSRPQKARGGLEAWRSSGPGIWLKLRIVAVAPGYRVLITTPTTKAAG